MGRQKRCSATQKRQYWKESVQQYQNKFASTWKEYCHFDWEQCSDEPAGTEVIRNYIEDVIEAQPTLKGKFKVVDVKNQTLFDHLAIHGIVLDGKRASLSSQFPMNTTRSFALCGKERLIKRIPIQLHSISTSVKRYVLLYLMNTLF
eukprot:m.213531 g.213531  ORF g.213531 m.213531 type:complete len:147 (-) comp15523_c0_seq4:485-925(-)